jgi:hypothetical protein
METTIQDALFNDANLEEEWWDPFDERFGVPDRPTNTPEFKQFCASLKQGQIAAVVMGRYYTDALGWVYELCDGRKRVLGCQALQKPVRVTVLDVNGHEDIIRIRFSANWFRSANEAADVKAIAQGVLSEGKNYDEVIPGMSKQEAVRLHKKWQNVPVEYVDAVIAGQCAEGTALEVGKLRGKARNRALDTLEEAQQEGRRVTSKDIKGIRSAVQAKSIEQTMTWLPEKKVVRNNFSRMEIERLATLYETDFESALEYKNELLG